MNQPPDAFTIRTAKPADADNITRLMKSEPGFWNDRWPESIVARALAAPTTIALVALAAAEPAPEPVPLLASPAVRPQHAPVIAAFACAHHLGFRGYLSELIVAANHRGQGIASPTKAAPSSSPTPGATRKRFTGRKVGQRLTPRCSANTYRQQRNTHHKP